MRTYVVFTDMLPLEEVQPLKGINSSNDGLESRLETVVPTEDELESLFCEKLFESTYEPAAEAIIFPLPSLVYVQTVLPR